MTAPVRVGSLRPAVVVTLLGAVLGIVAFGLGIAVAALLFLADGSDFVPALIGACAVMAAIGAVCGWASWHVLADRVDWPRRQAERRIGRTGRLERARIRARRLLDGRQS